MAVTQFLAEFARALLAAGLSYSHFAALARTAFFRAASESATFRNQRVNHSAVAAMTGLTRVQVRALAKQESQAVVAKRDRIARIVEGWTTDPAFTGSDLGPRRLNVGGTSFGFAQLVRKYGGDIPPRAMLREMTRKGYVSVSGRYAQLNPEISETKAQERLRRVSDALTALISGSRLGNGSTSGVRSQIYEATYPGTSAKGRILLQRRSADSLRAFVAELQASGSAASVESPPSRKQRGLTTRTRVVLVSEDFESESPV